MTATEQLKDRGVKGTGAGGGNLKRDELASLQAFAIRTWQRYQPDIGRFPWNKGISNSQLPFEVRSCEVAIIWPWPDTYIHWALPKHWKKQWISWSFKRGSLHKTEGNFSYPLCSRVLTTPNICIYNSIAGCSTTARFREFRSSQFMAANNWPIKW